MREFLDGFTDISPLMLGVAPFGVVFGVLGVDIGMDPLAVFFMSSILFGGASQIIFAHMASFGTSLLIITGTVGIVNLRHMLYSASMVEYLGHLPLRWKILLAYLLTDEAFVISNNRMRLRPRGAHMHYHLLGTGLTLWVIWQISTLVGIIVGNEIPPSLGLTFTLPLCFLAITAPQLKHLPYLIAFFTAGIMALIGQNLPWNTGIIVAATTGAIVGAVAGEVFPGKAAS